MDEATNTTLSQCQFLLNTFFFSMDHMLPGCHVLKLKDNSVTKRKM